MDLLEILASSEAVEISLKNGHMIYGKFLKMLESMLMFADPDGNVILIPNTGDNISSIKLISADPELAKMMDKLYGSRPSKKPVEIEIKQNIIEEEITPRQVDEKDIPLTRQAAIEAVKERFRHNTNFTTSYNAGRPAFKPRIESEEQ